MTPDQNNDAKNYADFLTKYKGWDYRAALQESERIINKSTKK